MQSLLIFSCVIFINNYNSILPNSTADNIEYSGCDFTAIHLGINIVELVNFKLMAINFGIT